MARLAASHYPDGIFRGTQRSGGPEGNLRTPLYSSRVSAMVFARPSGQQNRNLIRSCRRAPTSPLLSPQPQASIGAGCWSGTACLRVPLGRSARPRARRPCTRRSRPGPRRRGRSGLSPGTASRLRLRGQELGPGLRPPTPAPAPLPSQSRPREAQAGGAPVTSSSPSLGLLSLHSRAAIYLEWVVPACLPRPASRSPEVEH